MHSHYIMVCLSVFYSLLFLYFYFSPHVLFHQFWKQNKEYTIKLRKSKLMGSSCSEVCLFFTNSLMPLRVFDWKYWRMLMWIHERKKWENAVGSAKGTIPIEPHIELVCSRENVLFKWNDEWIIKRKQYTQTIDSARAANQKTCVCIAANLFENIAPSIKKNHSIGSMVEGKKKSERIK